MSTILSMRHRMKRLEIAHGLGRYRLPDVGVYCCEEGETGPPPEYLGSLRDGAVVVCIVPAPPEEPGAYDHLPAPAAAPEWRFTNGAWTVDGRQASPGEVITHSAWLHGGLPAVGAELDLAEVN